MYESTGIIVSVQDKGYRDFQSKVDPDDPGGDDYWRPHAGYTEASKRICQGSGECSVLMQLPHTYYDENILHALAGGGDKRLRHLCKRGNVSALCG